MTDIEEIRRQAYRRDRGVCSRCGLDTEDLGTYILGLHNAWVDDTTQSVCAGARFLPLAPDPGVQALVRHRWSVAQATAVLRPDHGRYWLLDHALWVVTDTSPPTTLCTPCATGGPDGP